ncbi:hypothetical protein COCNU_scaffold036080G000010 [Cocos nucifera]|nr:hypothetical protein [Cocos nucifera]
MLRGQGTKSDSYDSLLQLVHHMEHFVKVLKEVWEDTKDLEALIFNAEALAIEASKKRDEALEAKSMAEEEVRLLKPKLKLMETKVA